ncbi:hypothetical protein Gotur_035627, partial [Gossypium turneri]
IYCRKIAAIENYTKGNVLTIATRLIDFNFPEDLNGHGIACALIAFGTLTVLKWLKDYFGIFDSKIQGGSSFARLASYKVSDDKVTIDKSVEFLKKNSLLDTMGKIILEKVYVIMVYLRTYTLSNLSLYLCDPVNMGRYLAKKENIVVCTSFAYLADSFYILSGWLAPL